MGGGQAVSVIDAVRLTPRPDVIDLPSSRPKPTMVSFVPAGGRNAVLIGSGAIPVTGDDSFRIARSPAVCCTYSGSTAMLSTPTNPKCWKKSAVFAGSATPAWTHPPYVVDCLGQTQCAAVSAVSQPISTAVQNADPVVIAPTAGKSAVSRPWRICPGGGTAVAAAAA